jgi:hypothetical protein
MLTTHSLSLVGAKLPRRWLARANEALALSAPAPPWRAISTSAAPFISGILSIRAVITELHIYPLNRESTSPLGVLQMMSMPWSGGTERN